MLLTEQDMADFLHVTRQDGAYIILQKNNFDEFDRHDWTVVTSDFEYSREYTELKAARDFCYAVLNLLDVKTRCKETGLRLAIEVVKEKPKTEDDGSH